MSYRIPVAKPFFNGSEKKYVDDCLETGWISSAGKYIELFESGFADFCGVKHAVACCNGTVALHLALAAFGVQTGDEVIVPTLTFIATPNAVTYCGATPVFADSEISTWNLDPRQVEAKITPRTKGIIAVHLYGQPAQMDELRDIARRHNLFLIEDAAEAHGALYDGKTAGSIGDAAAFSFYANKIITTGEGGMFVTDRDDLAEYARLLRGQGMDPHRRYWHPVVGFNYRMMNPAAAIGYAQLEIVERQIEARVKIAGLYREYLKAVPGIKFQIEDARTKHVYWMVSIVLDAPEWQNRDAVMAKLAAHGIETRPVFFPAHSMPPYITTVGEDKFPVAEQLSAGGISLPTWTGLTEREISFICEILTDCRADF